MLLSGCPWLPFSLPQRLPEPDLPIWLLPSLQGSFQKPSDTIPAWLHHPQLSCPPYPLQGSLGNVSIILVTTSPPKSNWTHCGECCSQQPLVQGDFLSDVAVCGAHLTKKNPSGLGSVGGCPTEGRQPPTKQIVCSWQRMGREEETTPALISNAKTGEQQALPQPLWPGRGFCWEQVPVSGRGSWSPGRRAAGPPWLACSFW